MRLLKYIFCTFSALWLPISFLASVLGIKSLLRFREFSGEPLLYATLAGCILLLIDHWQSQKTNDDKIWWSVLGVMFFPIAAPAYWFGYGLKNLERENQNRGSS